MSHKSFVWLCLLPLAVVTAAFFLLPMARLVVTGAEGPQGLAGYLGVRLEMPNVNLRVGGRYWYTLRRSFLAPEEKYSVEDIELREARSVIAG